MIKRVSSMLLISMAFVFPAAIYMHANVAHAATKKAAPKPINVKVATVVKQKVPKTLSAVGYIRAIKSVELSFQLDGQLKSISHKAGRVKKGEVLAELDDVTDMAQLKSDQANYDLAKNTYNRYLKLATNGDVSKQVLEQKKAAMVTQEALVEKDKATIAQKKLTAPFGGVLGSTDYSVGAYLPKGTSIFKLVQLAPLKARYSIPASMKTEVEIGQTITVKSDTFPKKTFPGLVSFIAPAVNSQSGTISVDAQVKNPDYSLSPGMFVSIEQVVDANRELIVIPDIALMTDVKGRYVFVVNDDHVSKEYVKVGEITQKLASITSGLKVGDVVVTAGQQRLDDGSEINIIGHTKEASSGSKK